MISESLGGVLGVLFGTGWERLERSRVGVIGVERRDASRGDSAKKRYWGTRLSTVCAASDWLLN